MSFSHLDKNIVFEPQTEQLHVAGNKALIFAHLAQLAAAAHLPVRPEGNPGVRARIRRLTRDAKDFQPGAPEGSVAQADISETGTIGPDGSVVVPFTVKGGPQPADGSPDASKNIFNGGMRVDATAANIQGIGTGTAAMAIQCRGCDEHPGVTDDDEWVTVSEDYNQSPLYAQAGITVAVNRPQAFKADGTPIEWRAVISGNALGVGLPLTPAVGRQRRRSLQPRPRDHRRRHRRRRCRRSCPSTTSPTRTSSTSSTSTSTTRRRSSRSSTRVL